MAWYKIEIHYGPGSQGTDITYRWWDCDPQVPSREEQREWCEDRVHDLYTDNATSRVDLVEALPEAVRQEKIEMYRSRMSGAAAMLKVLEAPELLAATEEKPCPCADCEAARNEGAPR